VVICSQDYLFELTSTVVHIFIFSNYTLTLSWQQLSG